MDTDQDQDRGTEASDARKSVQDADAIFSKLKGWFKLDYDSEGQTRWRREAREDFAFEAGEQLTDEDKQLLRDMNRPIVIFNQVGTYVDAVSGQEIGNRQEVQFIPRKQGDVKKNEFLTSAAQWFRDQSEAGDEESDAFRDVIVAGMGWTDTMLNFEENPDGDPKVERMDPLEMVWDSSAKKRNLRDKRRVFHIRRNVPIDEARALCPGDPQQPFEDADYNATWVDDRGETEGDNPHHNDGRTYNKGERGEDGDDHGVTMVRAQWIERVPVWRVVDPADQTGKTLTTMNEEEYRDLGKRMKIAGVQMPKAVKQTRKVYRQAYLGNVLLEIGDAPIAGHFSMKCMTGKRDRNRNTFFGIVRAMKDPSRWANKWLMQTMHIMNSTAKGGIAVERGQFFENDAEGAASWAKQDQTTFLKPGSLGANPKMIAKTAAQFPQGSFELMQFAFGAMGRVSGINLEAVGMQTGADQAAALDLQRKQAVMTLMQPYFDGLRRYRHDQGRALLFLIENYLSDGRLIKIEGPENAQYVPLVKEAYADDAQGYDVIVDEAPTSANQKEATWAMLQQILPVIGKMLPPATWLALLKYSPLPTSAQKDISDSLQQAQQNGDPEQQKRDAELKFANDKAQADIANTKAHSDAKIAALNAETGAKIEARRQEAQAEALHKALAPPPQTVAGPDGQPVQVQPHDGGQAALVVQLLAEMRRDMNMLAQAINTPKQLIRNQAGDIVGIAPMQQG